MLLCYKSTKRCEWFVPVILYLFWLSIIFSYNALVVRIRLFFLLLFSGQMDSQPTFRKVDSLCYTCLIKTLALSKPCLTKTLLYLKLLMIRLNIYILNIKLLNSNFKLLKQRSNFSSGKSDKILAKS